MTQYDIAPAFIKLFYTRDTVPHTQTLPVWIATDPPVPGTNEPLVRYDNSDLTFSQCMADYVAVFKALFGATVTLNYAELWSKPLPDDDPIWIYTTSPNAAGTNGTAAAVAEEVILTYRTSLGHIARLYAMEASLPVNVVYHSANIQAPYTALDVFLRGASNFIRGRDGGKLVNLLSVKSKYNDVLRRKLLTG